eukprot:10796235-Ditylum_brightwellii.AAC.1
MPLRQVVGITAGVHDIKSIALVPSVWVLGVLIPCAALIMSQSPVSATNGAKSLLSRPELASTRSITSPSLFH